MELDIAATYAYDAWVDANGVLVKCMGCGVAFDVNNREGKVEINTAELVTLIAGGRNAAGWQEVIRRGEIFDIADAVAAGAPIMLKDNDAAMLVMICDMSWRFSFQACCWRCFRDGGKAIGLAARGGR
jgi:hypothetical protein